MSYLSDEEFEVIAEEVALLSIKEVDDNMVSSFESNIEEYDHYLKMATLFDWLNISKTFVLIHRKTKELIAYMTLSADAIKLTSDEKEVHHISKVPYATVPALKIGKLAVNKNLSELVDRKGYGSFMLELARGFAFEMNVLGIACRFLTVDADIEYNESTPRFYEKNGFVINLCNKSRVPRHTISMRKDIFT